MNTTETTPLSSEAQAVIQALTELYETVLKMSDRPITDIQHAPTDGHVLPATLQLALNQHKSPEVVDLIRHLPFATVHLGVCSVPIDYLHEQQNYYWLYQSWRPLRWNTSESEAVEAIVLPEELPITEQYEERGGILVIDTRDWSARVYNDTHGGSCNLHSNAGECPPLCRHQAKLEVGPAVEILRKWKHNYLDLSWMVDRQGPEVIDSDWPEEYFEKLQNTYRRHGWPDNFEGSKCREALERLPPVGDDWYTFGTDSGEEDQ